MSTLPVYAGAPVDGADDFPAGGAAGVEPRAAAGADAGVGCPVFACAGWLAVAGFAAGAAAPSLAAEALAADAPPFAPLPAAAATPSSSRMRLPSDTLSPTLSFNSLTVPAAGDGTSIVAL